MSDPVVSGCQKYVPRANVKEIRLRGKLQLYLATELAGCCSQVIGLACAPPYLNLAAAAVGTVITEVMHKSQSKRLKRRGERPREGESKEGERERDTDYYSLRARGGPDTHTDKHTVPSSKSSPSVLSFASFFFSSPTQSTQTVIVCLSGFTSFPWLWQLDFS